MNNIVVGLGLKGKTIKTYNAINNRHYYFKHENFRYLTEFLKVVGIHKFYNHHVVVRERVLLYFFEILFFIYKFLMYICYNFDS